MKIENDNNQTNIKIKNTKFVFDKNGLKAKKTTLKSNLNSNVETSIGYHFVSQMEQTKK